MAQSSSSAAIGMAAPSRGQPSPPIASLLPLATSALTAGLSVLSYLIWFLNTILLSVLSPFLVIIPIVLYIFSPIIVSSKVLLDLLVVLPYRVTVYTSQAFHPIYAFLGVACLSGALLGFGARQLVSLIGWGLLGEIHQGAQRSGSPTRARPQKRPSAIARGKRRVTVKAED